MILYFRIYLFIFTLIYKIDFIDYLKNTIGKDAL